MITAINNSGGALIAARTMGSTKPKSTTESPTTGTSAGNGVVRLGTKASTQDDIPRAGFGANTVSSPGAALRTIGRGVEAARQVVPTLQEIQDERAARNAVGSLETKGNEAAPALDLSGAGVAAVAGARNYVNALGDAAETAQARLAGTAKPSNGTQASVSISGETVALYSRRTDKVAGTFGETTTPQIDIRA